VTKKEKKTMGMMDDVVNMMKFDEEEISTMRIFQERRHDQQQQRLKKTRLNFPFSSYVKPTQKRRQRRATKYQQ
jgi:hypothetical protein